MVFDIWSCDIRVTRVHQEICQDHKCMGSCYILVGLMIIHIRYMNYLKLAFLLIYCDEGLRFKTWVFLQWLIYLIDLVVDYLFHELFCSA